MERANFSTGLFARFNFKEKLVDWIWLWHNKQTTVCGVCVSLGFFYVIQAHNFLYLWERWIIANRSVDTRYCCNRNEWKPTTPHWTIWFFVHRDMYVTLSIWVWIRRCIDIASEKLPLSVKSTKIFEHSIEKCWNHSNQPTAFVENRKSTEVYRPSPSCDSIFPKFDSVSIWHMWELFFFCSIPFDSILFCMCSVFSDCSG